MAGPQLRSWDYKGWQVTNHIYTEDLRVNSAKKFIDAIHYNFRMASAKTYFS